MKRWVTTWGVRTALVAALAAAAPARADEATSATPGDDGVLPANAPPPPNYLPPPMTPQPAPAVATASAAPAGSAPPRTANTAAPPPVTYPQQSPAQAPTVMQAPPASNGQWVYTAQYGWVWMPYERAYTYVAPSADVAYAYVYYPAVGWHWVWAPWVLGWGSRPYWGLYGRAHFVWYAHPWFHPRLYPGYAGRPIVRHAPHYHGGFGYHGGGHFHRR